MWEIVDASGKDCDSDLGIVGELHSMYVVAEAGRSKKTAALACGPDGHASFGNRQSEESQFNATVRGAIRTQPRSTDGDRTK
jgi:hypothetical protein